MNYKDTTKKKKVEEERCKLVRWVNPKHVQPVFLPAQKNLTDRLVFLCWWVLAG